MTGRCHRCRASVVVAERVGHRDRCDGCDADLHCCLNCKFYEVGYHNDCRETQAERQVIKEIQNYCDYFVLAPVADRPPVDSAESAARADLFGLFRRGDR